MKSVDLYRNADGSWTARIFYQLFNARTKEECEQWLRNQGEPA